MNKKMAISVAAGLFLCAAPAAAQLDEEGIRLLNEKSQCVEKHALEKDDGVKSPATIADQVMLACNEKSIAFEDYLVRHSVRMSDKVRSDLRQMSRKEAISFVLLYRKAGRVDAPNQ